MKQAPGLYKRIPFDTYNAWDGLSQSQLSWLRKSPAHLKNHLDQKQDEDQTEAQKIGNAVHAAILTPLSFTAQYVTYPKIDRRTTAGKTKYQEIQNENLGKILISEADKKLCDELAFAVNMHGASRTLLEGADPEMSMVWERDGVLCKGRMDAYNFEYQAVIDLKTTIDASYRAFSKSIVDYGYYRQAAWYLNGARSLGLPVQHFVFIAIEKSPPYAVAAYRITAGSLQLADQENMALLAKYRTCKELNNWPAYSHEIQDISLPEWATLTLEKTYGPTTTDTAGSADIQF